MGVQFCNTALCWVAFNFATPECTFPQTFPQKVDSFPQLSTNKKEGFEPSTVHQLFG
jgi:hypothetical protein